MARENRIAVVGKEEREMHFKASLVQCQQRMGEAESRQDEIPPKVDWDSLQGEEVPTNLMGSPVSIQIDCDHCGLSKVRYPS